MSVVLSVSGIVVIVSSVVSSVFVVNFFSGSVGVGLFFSRSFGFLGFGGFSLSGLLGGFLLFVVGVVLS